MRAASAGAGVAAADKGHQAAASLGAELGEDGADSSHGFVARGFRPVFGGSEDTARKGGAAGERSGRIGVYRVGSSAP